MQLRVNIVGVLATTLAAIVLTAPLASASDYPTKPVSIVIGYGPGGASDFLTRALATELETVLGKPVVVAYKPGATGTIGMNFVAKATPDGYTLGFAPGSFAITPHFETVPYDVTKDFTYLATLGNFMEGFFVRADSPFKTMADLVAYARQNPNKLNVGMQGAGSSMSIMLDFVAEKAGIRWTQIPFKSDADNVSALLGRHIDVGINLGGQLPQVKAKALRMLAVNTARRLEDFPEVPTLIESGYNFTTLTLLGIIGPKGLPEPTVKTLMQALAKAKKAPAYMEVARKLNVNPLDEMGKEFEEHAMRISKTVSEITKR